MTSLTHRGLLLLALITTVVGCRKSDFYCPGAPDDNCNNIDAPDPPECTSSAQCSAPKPVCDLPTQTCVACTASDHDACVGTTPICGSDQTCHPCSAHTDCPSNACLPDGACGGDTNVAYVDPMGTDNALCTKASPCTKLDKALATNRKHVKFHGRTDAQVTLSRDVTLLADPGAQLSDTSNGILIEVEGASKVAIYDLEITGASGINNPGISLRAGNTATVSLTRAKVTANIGGGITAVGGTLIITQSTLSGNAGGGIVVSGGSTVTVTQSTLSGNTGGGISASGGTLMVTRSTLSGNTGGGISASGGTLMVTQSTLSDNVGGGISVMGTGTAFDIENNVITYNGKATGPGASAPGGAVLLSNTDGSKFAFNTVAFNQNDGLIYRAGAMCTGPMVTAQGNIVYGNTEGTTTSDATQSGGGCQFGTSLSLGSAPADLGFKSPRANPFDFHLTATSPTSVVNAGGPCTGADFDGDTRPIGAACDLGADEYHSAGSAVASPSPGNSSSTSQRTPAKVPSEIINP